MQPDMSKLSRDFSRIPIRRGEIIPKSDVEYVYLTLNLSREEAAKLLGTGEMGLRRLLRYYNIQKPHELGQRKAQHTCLAKYGVSHPFLSKGICAKAHDTVLTRYGVENVFQTASVKEKSEQTNLRKYGYTNYSKVPECNKTRKQTMLNKYGVESGMQVHVEDKVTWYSDEALKSFIEAGNSGSKWTTRELAEHFNLDVSTVQVRIGALSLWTYITQSTSKEELELTDIITAWGFKVTKYQDKQTEFDVYIPSKKIAIEFNGNYWHSTRVRADYKYHIKKTQYANKLGIFLYHVFEYEWINRKQQVISQLVNLLGKNENKVFARKCNVENVGTKEAAQFLDANHVQGRANASVRLGLYNEGQLVSIMTFGKSRFNKNVAWELVRFCSLKNTNVTGGASKLFKHFIKTYSPQSVVSYADIAKTTGRIYDTLGFACTAVSAPNYVWVNHNCVLSRYSCQKHRLIKQGYNNLGATEKAIMEARNFAQVFDCGSKTYIWNNA